MFLHSEIEFTLARAFVRYFNIFVQLHAHKLTKNPLKEGENREREGEGREQTNSGIIARKHMISNDLFIVILHILNELDIVLLIDLFGPHYPNHE